MNNKCNQFGPWWFICLVLLFALIAGCSNDSELPYTGPCPQGQASWDCMAWNEANWE